ncbi:Uncharacterised protein [Mycobacteroides abscessus subsp. abscessus]|nr:hypothetical protein [Mycobacteroides abscessus]SLD03323.1 Uncharacterised protein [Mycobacteroides abscessus subsp. abscessus]SLG33970.1 Uncharacterised protein [Mycobacteroides abscessus subsp. abscessus]SLK93429.1 Uncharacterised protein [Mycobacteroides abscessus subsp. abscessus]
MTTHANRFRDPRQVIIDTGSVRAQLAVEAVSVPGAYPIPEAAQVLVTAYADDLDRADQLGLNRPTADAFHDFAYGYGHGHMGLTAAASETPTISGWLLLFTLQKKWPLVRAELDRLAERAARPCLPVPVPQTH